MFLSIFTFSLILFIASDISVKYVSLVPSCSCPPYPYTISVHLINFCKYVFSSVSEWTFLRNGLCEDNKEISRRVSLHLHQVDVKSDKVLLLQLVPVLLLTSVSNPSPFKLDGIYPAVNQDLCSICSFVSPIACPVGLYEWIRLPYMVPKRFRLPGKINDTVSK